jgi:hypothetical protein
VKARCIGSEAAQATLRAWHDEQRRSTGLRDESSLTCDACWTTSRRDGELPA